MPGRSRMLAALLTAAGVLLLAAAALPDVVGAGGSSALGWKQTVALWIGLAYTAAGLFAVPKPPRGDWRVVVAASLVVYLVVVFGSYAARGTPDLWQALGVPSLRPSFVVVDLAFLAAAFASMGRLRCRGDAAVYLALLASPSVMWGFERANIDLLVF